MVLERVGESLVPRRLTMPAPSEGEVLLRVEACGVCRTDLHVVDGDLPEVRLPVIPGHECVGRVVAVGPGVDGVHVDERMGVPWLAGTCQRCDDCLAGAENLCGQATFTGYTRPGGFATHIVARAAYCVSLPEDADPVALAPLLCAGLIGWRALTRTGHARRLGLYGFGASAHIVAQIARAQQRDVYAFTRPGDIATQSFARALGACWAGGSNEPPPAPLDAAILFAPDGALVPLALRAVRKGGKVVCAGIHMSDIPSFPYRLLWGERELLSVANLTRDDARSFFATPATRAVHTRTRSYPLSAANDALADLRHGVFQGAAVLVPPRDEEACTWP
ncbi:zinc-dependent alcohol dehydrogenase family protein [Luteibacter sp. UNCMF331Sha3.1]|uniref:zinc-dependent alcohol dehydrogenase family protein n=1 Tax=Luteibacter sp. UNCMF331Sha3.1 TaxID=1502760 RepID=UPI00244E7AB5|nr:zinc-dependent alcohol dehydrogenase family protein [Luteibacter sp. UNCMF331Sha3.1]